MGHLIVIHKIKHGWLVIFLKTGAYNKGSYYIEVGIITSLHLVKPLLLICVEGLQGVFHLSQSQAIALTPVSTVGDFIYWLLPISNKKTQMQYVLKFYWDFPCEWRIYNTTAHFKTRKR